MWVGVCCFRYFSMTARLSACGIVLHKRCISTTATTRVVEITIKECIKTAPIRKRQKTVWSYPRFFACLPTGLAA